MAPAPAHIGRTSAPNAELLRVGPAPVHSFVVGNARGFLRVRALCVGRGGLALRVVLLSGGLLGEEVPRLALGRRRVLVLLEWVVLELGRGDFLVS